MHFNKLRTIVTIVLTSMLIFLSTAPRSELKHVPIFNALSKYEQHAVAAFLLALIVWWWLYKPFRGWSAIGVIGLTMAVAGVVEVVQLFIPHRGGNVNDLKPALVGSSLGVMVASVTTILGSWIRKFFGGITND